MNAPRELGDGQGDPGAPHQPVHAPRAMPPAKLEALKARVGDRSSNPMAQREQQGRDE